MWRAGQPWSIFEWITFISLSLRWCTIIEMLLLCVTACRWLIDSAAQIVLGEGSGAEWLLMVLIRDQCWMSGDFVCVCVCLGCIHVLDAEINACFSVLLIFTHACALHCMCLCLSVYQKNNHMKSIECHSEIQWIILSLLTCCETQWHLKLVLIIHGSI